MFGKKLLRIMPNLQSVTVRGKYKLPETDFSKIVKTITQTLSCNWAVARNIGESIAMIYCGKHYADMISQDKKNERVWQKLIREVRTGVPLFLSITVLEHIENSILIEIECRPDMWFRIATFKEESFTENDVQEALIECRAFVKQVVSIFKGREVEPVSVYPIIQRTEIKSRLVNLGLKEVVDTLDKAEKHIVQNNFAESLKSSRTAFEKTIDWQMEKRGLKKTDNYKNDMERLKSKGYLDEDTNALIYTYYHCLSSLGVHEKGDVKPGFYEAQMMYGITLIVLDYFTNKLP